MCEICVSTYTGVSYQYSHLNHELFKTVAGVGNILRTDSGAFKQVKTISVKAEVWVGKEEFKVGT